MIPDGIWIYTKEIRTLEMIIMKIEIQDFFLLFKLFKR